jgi:hypothetical protein
MVQAETRLDMGRYSSVENEQDWINYNTSGWTAVASTSQIVEELQEAITSM